MRTKNVRGLAATAALLLIICMGVTAASAQSVSVVSQTSTTDLCPGDQFTVTVDVDSGTHTLRGVFMDLTYDSTVFDVMSVTLEDDLFAGNYLGIGGGDDGAGTIDFGISSTAGTYTQESGTLATVVFKVETGAPDATYNLGLQEVMLMDAANTLISGVTETPGTAEVDCGGTTPVPTVEVSPETTTNLCHGDQFTVTVDVDSGTHTLRGVFMDLTYDSTVFDVMSVTLEDDLFAGNYLGIGGGDDGAGTIDFGISSTAGTYTQESGTLATVVFKVETGAPEATYNLGLQNVQLMDAANTLISGVTETPGTAEIDCNDPPTVTVTSPVSGTVSGTIDVTATATDTDGSVTQVAFYLMPAGTLIGTDTNAAGGWSCPLDTTAAADGTGYQIKAVATDNEGATGDDTGGVFEIDNSCPCDFCLDLDAGWNFVSVPNTLNGSNDANTVFNLTLGETCLYYDCVDGWKSNSAVSVVPCQGYWVGKVASDQICLDFDPGTGAITPPEQNLCQGWNMIGHIHTSTMPVNDGSAADFGSITTLEGKFAQIWQWTQSGGWECYPLGGFTDMTPGQGYWILTTEATPMYGTK